MAGTNIDNLNFEIILKDENFEKKIKANIELAKQFNVALSDLLNLQNKAGLKGGANVSKQAIDQQKLAKATTDAAAAQERLKTAQNNTAASAERLAAASANRAAAEQRAVKATAGAVKAQRQMLSSVMATNNAVKTQSRLMSELKTMAMGYLSIRGAYHLLQSLVRITGEFELQRVALGSMIGDLNKAEQLVTRIQELAVKSPFQFKELTSYAKQLSAFSVPANELFETTKMLADVSAGLGVGMDRIILAYGQIRSAAFLRGQEVRQLTEAGIPILKELADQFSQLEGRAVSAGEVFDKISARLVPFEMVAKVFKDMTSEGGKFYEMQELQAETLRGKVMNLKDAYEIMMNEIGSANEDRLKGWVDSLRNLMKNWERLGNILIGVIATYGTYRATLLAIKAINWVGTLNETIKSYKMLNATLTFLNQKTLTYKDAMAAAGLSMNAVWAGAAGLAVGAVTMITRAIIKSRELNKELEKIRDAADASVDKLVGTLEDLVSSLSKATEGTQEYRDIISEINRRYKDYLPNLLTEADGYAKVALEADKAAIAVRNKAKADAEAQALAKIEEENRKRLSKRTDDFSAAVLGLGGGISKQMAKDIKQSFDAALLEEGAMDDILATFERVYNSYMGEDSFQNVVNKLAQRDSHAADLYTSNIEKYAKARNEINDLLDEEREKIDEMFENTFSTKEERLEVEKIDSWFRGQVDGLKQVKQTQEEYDEELRKLNIQKLEKLADLYERMSRPDIAKEYEEQAKALRGLQEGWRGDINNALKGMGLKKNTSFNLWADEYTQSVKYVEDLVKRYKEIDDEMAKVESFDSDMAKNLQRNKDAIEAVAKALKLDLSKLIETKKNNGGGKSQEQIEIETQIDLVKKLQDAYEKLYPFLTDGQMKDTLSKLFPEAKAEWLESFDFSEVLKKLADDLAKYDEEAAKRLRASVGKDVASSLASAFKEIETYKKMLDEWFGQDFKLEGKGVAFDISKIARDLNNEYAKVDQKRFKALELLKKAQMGDEQSLKIVRETYGEDVWEQYVVNGQNAIDELARLEKDAAKKTADEKIRDLANRYVTEYLKKENVDLTDFGDKTLKQIDTILDRVRTIYQDTNAKLLLMELDGISDEELAEYEMLKESLKQLGVIIDDVVVERTKEANDVLKDSFNAIGTLAGDIGALGEALGSAGIASAAKDLSDMASMASKLVDAFEAKDTIAIIANIASAVISKVTDVVTASYEQQRKLNEAASEYRDIMLDIRREAYSGVFGTDEMALAAENQKILAESLDEYSNSLDAFENQRKLRTQNYFDGRMEFKKMSVSDVVGNIADAQGWDLYRENGELNMEALKAYYDAYSEHLTKKQRDVVDALIASYDAQNDAAAQSAEYLTGLFSGVADNIAESMIDAFLESGDAAIDMGNIISDVSRQMVADLIKSIYLMPILNKYKEDIAKVDANTALSPTEATEQKLNLLDTALQEIAGQSDRITETIERFEDYLRSPEDEGTSALGEGIKGITEDQANLLASYLNAIRADVAYSKTLWVRMDANLQRIADMFTSSPTLMEYQAQIAANTYNTAIATQEILSQLRSVVTTDSGDTAIRVYS